MNKGLCANCKHRTPESTTLCNHPVVSKISSEYQGDEGKIRMEVKKNLEVQFQPYSWAVRWCKGHEESIV